MFWTDRIAKDIIQSGKYKSYWVNDMKTPSGKIHVGALRGVVVHDLAFKALRSLGVKVKFTYIFDNHDPMDALPVYLSREKFEKYLGTPLYKVPSPDSKFKNYADYYAGEFKRVFNAIGCTPEIIWSTDLYESGKMNDVIKLCLDKRDAIRGIYEELYKKELPRQWYPFNVFCPNCGKVSSTTVTSWNGKEVAFHCSIDKVAWAKGCDFKGRVSPFSNKKGIAGKLPWKVEWPCKWKVLGVTVEGAGKDHMSAGGSHDLAKLICERVLNYEVPYPIAYEFFLVGGKKMSSSKGLGSSASEMLEILPPEILRFLMVKTKINTAINFDPSGDTISELFDKYQKASLYKDPEVKRVFDLSQVGKKKRVPSIRFWTLTQWVQMPNMENEIKKEGLEEWAPYAKIWVERFAPESAKYTVQEKVTANAKKLSKEQKAFLKKLSQKIDKKLDAEEFQKNIYEWAKEMSIPSNDAFSAIYLSLIGKDYGPKAAWLILSLDKKFVKKRFQELQ